MVPTRDHDAIRLWAVRTDSAPAEIKPLKFDGEPSMLTFLSGDAKRGTEEMPAITWEDFFARFDLMELSMAFDVASGQFLLVKVEKSSSATAQA